MKELKIIAIKLKKKKDTDSYATYKTLHSTFDDYDLMTRT